LATIRLKESCKVPTLRLRNGAEGFMEVTKVEDVKISAFVASHYFGGNNCTVRFTSEDREDIENLPRREKGILSKHLRLAEEELANALAPLPPKKTVPEKLKATAKRATAKKPTKSVPKKTTKKANTQPKIEE
tara:strand:- start:6632 stop:7030 length:399 start_codon:yes stop_codon:yes gene_type:complete